MHRYFFLVHILYLLNTTTFFQEYRFYQDLSDHGYASDVHDESVEMLNDIVNRMKQVQLWQSRSMSSKQPKTSTHTIREYSGVKIDFEELTLKTKIGHGGLYLFPSLDLIFVSQIIAALL